MVTALLVADLLSMPGTVIDVRSPAEFVQGHIEGAVNIPLFDDAERAVVGTLYKQQGREAAMLEGLRITGPKLARIVERALAAAPERVVRVHCWRGGERSGSVAWLLSKSGFRVYVLTGGYKAFRNHVLDSFTEPWPLRLVGGFTGTGKTVMIAALGRAGEPVIDLEALAAHRGSAFGAIGQPVQSSTEHFENRLFAALSTFRGSSRIWLEDESGMIGRVKLPDPFFARMRSADVYFIDLAREERIERLLVDYGNAPSAELLAAFARIARRMGPQHAKAASQAVEAGDLRAAATLALDYYDKTYAHGLALRDPATVRRFPVDTFDAARLARTLIDHG